MSEKKATHSFVIEQYVELKREEDLFVTGYYYPVAVVHDAESARAIVGKAGYVESKIGQDGWMPQLRYSEVPVMLKEAPFPKLEDLGFSNRILNILAADGISNFSQLLIQSADDLIKGPHLGAKSLAEIRAKLAEKGYRLRGDKK